MNRVDERDAPAPVPTSADVSFPAYVTATTGAVLYAVQWVLRRPLPPEIYVWVQLTVPLLMGRGAAAWRVRHPGTR